MKRIALPCEQVYARRMGTYERLVTDLPELVDEHYQQAALVVRARDVAAELPDHYRCVVENLCNAFVDLRTRYEDEVVDGMEQARIVASLSARLEAALVNG